MLSEGLTVSVIDCCHDMVAVIVGDELKIGVLVSEISELADGDGVGVGGGVTVWVLEALCSCEGDRDIVSSFV